MDLKKVVAIMRVAAKCNVSKLSLDGLTIELYDQSNSFTHKPVTSKRVLDAQARAIEEEIKNQNSEAKEIQLLDLDLEDPVAYEQLKLSEE